MDYSKYTILIFLTTHTYTEKTAQKEVLQNDKQ